MSYVLTTIIYQGKTVLLNNIYFDGINFYLIDLKLTSEITKTLRCKHKKSTIVQRIQ